ncbi:hypothetical protein N9N67_06215, partial [Bacteriovoracaceae bacterium]|nr:hypothetical protein [Bacteriovoracaceae bacterium]
EFEIRQQTLSEGVVDVSDNQTENPLLMSSSNQRGMGLGLALGPKFDLMWSVPHESPSLLSARIQIIGEPEKSSEGGVSGHQLGFTFGMGAERDTYEGDVDIKMKYDIQDYSIVHGYGLGGIMLYDGIAFSTYKFEGTISSNDDLDGEVLNYSANNTMTLYGGVMWRSFPIKAKLEFSMQSVEWSNTERQMFYGLGYSFAVNW